MIRKDDYYELMDQDRELPSEETVCELLEVIAPGSTVVAVGPLPGSYSNLTHLVEARAVDGSIFRIVIRRYATFGAYDRGEKARREFKAFELLRKNGIPVPQPLYLDANGTLLGTPGIVTSYVPGKQIMPPRAPMNWARSLATMLARIHSIPCDTAAKSFLLNANTEATWFLRSGNVPDYMKAHPDGVIVWQTVHELWPTMQRVPPALVHIDYWSGNILWDEGEITAIVDWEEAAYGDPGIDVAYCRMDMYLSGVGHVADAFLNAYEVAMGRQVANLGFWELAAAARPMFHPDGWITESPAREEFRQFIAQARIGTRRT